MADTPKEEGKVRWWQRLSLKKLNRKYVFMMSHDETLEPIVDFKVNLLKLSLLMLLTVLVLMVITAIGIIFSPIKGYISDYSDQSTLDREVYELSRRADSIERELQRKDVYFNNLKLVIEGYDFSQDSLEQYDIYAPLLGFNADTVELRHSSLDSALRAEFEEENLYRLNPSEMIPNPRFNNTPNFFTPLVGTVSNDYNPSEGHFGVDIISTGSQVIKATLDGTVVYASWTLDYGYTCGSLIRRPYPMPTLGELMGPILPEVALPTSTNTAPRTIFQMGWESSAVSRYMNSPP